jgi:peptidoglycan hydrolase FlgJ
MDKISPNMISNFNPAKAPAGKAVDPEQEKKLKKACTDFESILVYQLLKTMRQTIPKGGLIGHSHGKDTYEMMFDQKIADELANKGKGLGLKTMLYNQISKQHLKKD